MPTILIRRLFYYPIKACAGIETDRLILDAYGARGDRRYLVVRAGDGRFLSQREHPRMATIHPTLASDGITVRAPGMSELFVSAEPAPSAPPRDVTIWRYTGSAIDTGDESARWFSEILGEPCRLVRIPPDWARPASASRAENPDDKVAFVDGFPLLFASEASLADLNARLGEHGPLPMERFRPNVVFTGRPAWDEDRWQTLTVPDTGDTFRAAKPCARCAVTTLDHRTGANTGPEPLRTLATFRRDADGKVNFAVNVLHDGKGKHITLRTGDRLEVH